MRTHEPRAPLTPEQQALVTRHYPGLVHWVARRYYGDKVPEDAMAAGAHGLVIAAQRFDPARRFAFNTYAHHWVRALILEQLVRDRGPVRYGTTMEQRRVIFGLGRARKAVGLVEDEVGAIAAHLGVRRATVEETVVRLNCRADVCLDATSDDRRTHEVVDEGALPEEAVGEAEGADARRQEIERAIKRLDVREAAIVRARYLRERPKTLDAVGRSMGISRERVRQLEVRALVKLRRALGVLEAAA